MEDRQKPAHGQSPQFIVLMGGQQVGVRCHQTIQEAWRFAAEGEYCGKAG